MGLIIKDKLNMFMKGYPTVSDKYNVAGGIIEGSYAGHFGDLVKNGSQAGYFKPVNASQTITAVTDIAGIILATNVQVAKDWPATEVEVPVGTAFNLLVNGFIAVQLSSGAVASDVTAGASVYATAAGKLTTVSDTSALKVENTKTPVPNLKFTGMIEDHGTASAHDYYAEVYVGC